MTDDATLFPDFQPEPPTDSAQAPPVTGTPRLRLPQRHQVEMRFACLDQLLTPDHQVRVVWKFVEDCDLAPLHQQIRAVEGRPGRPANDPRILLTLWLYATIDGVGSAREVDRLCREHIAYE